MPAALSALAGDYVRLIGAGMAYGHRELRCRSRCASGSGTDTPISGSPPTSQSRSKPRCGSGGPSAPGRRIPLTEAYWRDEAVPELRAVYAWVAARPVETMPAAELAETWDEAWARIGRCWSIHFYAIRGPYQVLEDLADLYESVIEDAGAGRGPGADRWRRSTSCTTSSAASRTWRRWWPRRRGSPSAWPSPASPSPTWRRLPDAGPFARALDAFLAEHGHLGQTFDDLTLASWAEEPGLLLAELAKRVRAPGRRSAPRNGARGSRPRRTSSPTVPGRRLAGDPATARRASRSSSPPPARSGR